MLSRLRDPSILSPKSYTLICQANLRDIELRRVHNAEPSLVGWIAAEGNPPEQDLR